MYAITSKLVCLAALALAVAFTFTQDASAETRADCFKVYPTKPGQPVGTDFVRCLIRTAPTTVVKPPKPPYRTGAIRPL